jgi:uncharacterized protein (TIGR03067 family)
MRLFLSALVLPALALGLTAAPVPKEKAKVKDEDAILGTWRFEKFDTGGADGVPKGDVEAIRMTFKKDGKMLTAFGPGGEKREAEYKLDPAAKVKAIDFVEKGGRTALGIYELDGDTLKLCLAEGKDPKRPTEMKPDGRMPVVTLKRVKEEKKDK